MIQMDIQLIELKKIRPVFMKQVSEKAIETRKRILEMDKSLNNVLTVQKDPKEDIYWLIKEDEDYLAYCKWQVKEYVYCVVTPYTDKTFQEIEKLKSMNMPRTTKWIDQHKLINKLKEEIPLTEMAIMTGVDPSDLQKFQFHKDVPAPYILKTYEKEKHYTILNKIAILYLGKVLSEHLYDRASLEDGNSYRLKLDQLAQVSRMVKIPGFEILDTKDQIEMLGRASEFQDILDATWRDDVNTQLKSYDPPRNNKFIITLKTKKLKKKPAILKVTRP